MKYIIEIKPEYEDSFKGLMLLGAKDSNLFVDTLAVENLEELNSDYINEHYGVMQDEAYQKGYDKGYADKTNNDEVCKKLAKDVYQKGLDDAWEAARKISILESDGGYSWKEMKSIFGTDSASEIYVLHTATEAINKIKTYEEKQKADGKIEVGDEVEWDNEFGDRFVVTRIYQPYGQKEQCDGIGDDGDVCRAVLIENLVKTGRHFNIEEIMEEMRT